MNNLRVPFMLALMCGTALPGSRILLAADAIAVKTSQNSHRLMPYQVFELTFQHEAEYRDPTWDVTIDVTFTAPGGKRYEVGGFFFGSSKPQKPVVHKTGDGHGRTVAQWPCEPADLWKARFAPAELGRWKFDYEFRNWENGRAGGQGEFEVVSGRNAARGFVRISKDNPFRLVFDDGSPFFPVGFQDGVFDNNANGSAMDSGAMEGPFRPDPERKRPVPPPGPLFARGPSMNPQNYDVLLGRHARAGFNLWRFSPNNFSIKVFANPQNADQGSLDHVRWEQAQMVDEMLAMTRKYGIRNFYGLFGYHPVFTEHPENAEGMAKVKRLIKYSVDRWGAYVDLWEFLNEQKADTRWYAIVIPYLKSVDPYRHPITTSWERPELDGIELSAPHWYGNENELSSDEVTAGRARNDKRFGKPVIYGEQGNSRGGRDLSAEGIGGVWDPGSARRMRVRLWTALFQETSLVFWETSYAKDGHHMNLWIGPEERQYVKAIQDFASRLDAGVKISRVHVDGPPDKGVRAFGLTSDRCTAVYLHHHSCVTCKTTAREGRPAHHRWDHDRGTVEGLKIRVAVSKPGQGLWYSPLDGSIVARFDCRAGEQDVAVPPLGVDLALLITDGAPPDSDRDGIANDEDQDDDNDGVPDAKDAWPLEREEWADADRDRIGDNLDVDLDGDGVADDRNSNGTPDNDEKDWDGDGVPNAETLPWDAFPRDAKEWRDTDGDGIGDNADQDKDGDGYSDQEEKAAGTDPLNALTQ